MIFAKYIKNKKIIMAISVVLVAVIAASLFYFFYWIKTPAYSLGLVRTAMEKHDLVQFERHVDLQSVYDRGFDALIQEELSKSGESNNVLITQTSHPKNIYNHNNIAVMQLLTFRTDRQN